ncbi:MAG: GDP-mannose 4,6-dehydratase [Acidimicrobiales bacterium]|nr:GDP-mannose 4,6-dehydratase [Acidimicrobiales bacterium]
MTRALITGVTGQDGSYLAELLVGKGYDVSGLVRRLSTPNLSNLGAVRGRVAVLDGDLLDQSSLDHAVRVAQPDEIYNLAAQSFVGTSWQQPVLTSEVTGLGALRVLEAARRFADGARVYQAGSSEMFGNSPAPQDESTPFLPRSPYGVAKLAAFHFARTYRESYGMFVANGILFNHESPRRGEEFVTRKVAAWAARVARGERPVLRLGNPDARRDWGYAPEYVELMWRALQHDRPDDFVGATGETHSVLEFVSEAMSVAGCTGPVEWGSPEVARPADVFDLRGDASKARRELGWEPQTRFRGLVGIMVRAEISRPY